MIFWRRENVGGFVAGGTCACRENRGVNRRFERLHTIIH